ncbi:uncharacterized protein LOC110861635 [Folsomia candida]|uniref:Uncharacterized protein n=1 Tax=Folsomia candida TaxID=158441 RepID=A0A226D0X7_FOLCA|nr:uncharacterized protein LOC110861635 [Folsomia candida]OXA38869.1 hypothetical protein Fcan01_26355 [Folsomia candida]
MAYGGSAYATRVLHQYKSTFDRETRLENADRYSAQELYNFSHTGRGTDFVFILNGELNSKKGWVYVKQSVVAAKSEILGKIMILRRARNINGREIEEDYYAMLDATTGFRELDIVQFKRMIEYLYTKNVESLRYDASPEELRKLSAMGSLFCVYELLVFCQLKLPNKQIDRVKPEVEVANAKNSGNNGPTYSAGIIRAPDSGRSWT